MDVIAMHQAGFNQAVASLGTALTPGHARLLKRYTDNVLITYDSDEAGVKAALRAIPLLKEAGITTKVVNMRPYKDPDEFIKALGQEAFQERLDNAENSFMYEISTIEKKYDRKDPEGSTSFERESKNKEFEYDTFSSSFADEVKAKKTKTTRGTIHTTKYDSAHFIIMPLFSFLLSAICSNRHFAATFFL